MRFAPVIFLCTLLGLLPAFAGQPTEEKVDFNLPAQTADQALLAFAKQARVDILFSYDDLRQVRSNAVVGSYEPQRALELLLKDTGFVPRRSGESTWVVAPGPPKGKVKGKVLAPDGSPARRVRVVIAPSNRIDFTDEAGEFELSDLAPGRYTVVVNAPDVRPLKIVGITVVANRTTTVGTQTLHRIEDPMQMEPFVVQADSTHAKSLDHSEAQFGGHSAGGNLDLARTETDALPYMIFNRTQITRSGVVNLNEFLQRELIDSSAGKLPPEQDPTSDPFQVGSTNLGLRGYDPDETVILVNGRRLPEVVTSMGRGTLPPDVNSIPLSLVQQVEVLPVSASSLYSGNAVGGVINIVLRPDVDANATEITATYTNALAHYDASESSLSLLHAESLLDGALRLRLNASFARSTPPSEAELGYRQRRLKIDPNLDLPAYGATPNVRSKRPDILPLVPKFSGDNAATEPASAPKTQPLPGPLPPLFGMGSSAVTSVAPGADGSGGLAAFDGRAGIRNFAFFDSMGAFSSSVDSLDFPYGREQQRSTYFGSVVYDVAPWLQVAFDGTYSNTVVYRGYEVIQGDLLLKAASPLNPFHQDVRVSLNETAPSLGVNYSQTQLDLGSVVFSTLMKLPANWRLSFDSQYSRNLVRNRGLIGADGTRWQALVDAGLYNPLRDTQVFGPPRAFYDQALIYRGRANRFVTVGDYETLDLAVRTTNDSIQLPTGRSTLNVGADYRRNHLGKYTDVGRYADGTPATNPDNWGARTLGRYSFFSELQAPVLSKRLTPKWLTAVDTDLALRYVAANNSKEANWAPTYGIKIGLPAGFTLRGSITTSSRYPTPTMSKLQASGGGGENTDTTSRDLINDYIRKERYAVNVVEVPNPDLRPVDAVTQTAGIVFQQGKTHRFRAALDFVDTHKVNEDVTLDKEMVTAKESFWPDRVVRAPAARGESVGLIQTVYTGRINLASRFSQDWTASLDYRWTGLLGGTLEAYARLLYFQRYIVRALPKSPRVDELNNPDGVVPLLKYRANFGASWSNKAYAFGWDGHYFHSRLLPDQEWEAQGHDRIRPYWQFDAFTQADIGRWIPWIPSRYGLRAQLRVNNVLAAPFPKYVNDAYGAGVQPYGDWRGRVYSISVTATF